MQPHPVRATGLALCVNTAVPRVEKPRAERNCSTVLRWRAANVGYRDVATASSCTHFKWSELSWGTCRASIVLRTPLTLRADGCSGSMNDDDRRTSLSAAPL